MPNSRFALELLFIDNNLLNLVKKDEEGNSVPLNEQFLSQTTEDEQFKFTNKYLEPLDSSDNNISKQGSDKSLEKFF